jgi:hypothetical protein
LAWAFFAERVKGDLMGELPSHSALAGVDPGTIYGLLAHHADPAVSDAYEFAWQRDKALIGAIDAALLDAAEGRVGMAGKKPRWLDGLVQRELSAASRDFWSQERFVRIRLLERLGVVEVEPDDTYILAMVSALGTDKAEKLRGDPELVERALWRVFEVEGGGEVSLTNVDRFGGEGWRRAFLELTSDGTLDRERVLAECLRALDRDFAAYRAGWFSATFLALRPSDDELTASQRALRSLLAAPVQATVAFALKQLIRVQKAGKLEVEETLVALPPATLVKAKGTALHALRLARSAGPDHADALVNVAETALGHTNADVQRAAADVLANRGAARTVVTAVDHLAPSVRQDLGFDLGVIAPQEPAALRQAFLPIPDPVTTTDLGANGCPSRRLLRCRRARGGPCSPGSSRTRGGSGAVAQASEGGGGARPTDLSRRLLAAGTGRTPGTRPPGGSDACRRSGRARSQVRGPPDG